MADDFGKPRFEAWMSDLMPVAAEAAHARKQLPRWMRPKMTWPGRANLPGRSWTVAEPKGTVLVIAPWNYPVQLALSPLVAAVAAGNTVVVKPSELAPATSAALARLLPQYLDPEGVAVVEGGVDVSTELLDLPFDHLFFTGSTTVGKVVMAAAARHLSSVTLELGGKSPVVVTRDADIEVAARRIAWGKLLNAGQTCIAPDYVLVERPVADQLVDALARSMGEMEGPGPHADPHPGSSTTVTWSGWSPCWTKVGGRVATGGSVDRDGAVDRTHRGGRPRLPAPPSCVRRSSGPSSRSSPSTHVAEAIGVHQPARTSPWPCTCSPARGPPNRRSSTRPRPAASA